MSSSVETESYSPVLCQAVRPREFLHAFNLPERPANSMASPLTILPPTPIHSTQFYTHSDSPNSSSTPSGQADCAVPILSAPQPRRPKLSLNTAATPQPRSFGRGNTGLRLDTLSAISPTVRNTFRNTYDPSAAAGASPSHRTASPSLPTWSPLHAAHSASTPSSSVSNTSCDSANPRPPYIVPHNIHSILRNTPLPKPQHGVMTSTPTSSTSRTLLFPPTRRVTFRPAQSLCEEITTTRFTARHQDLLDAELDDDTPASARSPTRTQAPKIRRSERALPPLASHCKEVCIDPQLLASMPGSSPSRAKMSPDAARTGDKRESSSPESERDEDRCPKTPIAGRAKKRREWMWTLGPIEGHET